MKKYFRKCSEQLNVFLKLQTIDFPQGLQNTISVSTQ